jgi:hypothetical protein
VKPQGGIKYLTLLIIYPQTIKKMTMHPKFYKNNEITLTKMKFSSKKRSREELGEEAGEEGKDPVDVLKAVGEVGKGFVRVFIF